VQIGGIEAAPATATHLLLWLALSSATGTPRVRIPVLQGESP